MNLSTERFTVEDSSAELVAAQQKGRGVVGAVRVPLTAIRGLGPERPCVVKHFHVAEWSPEIIAAYELAHLGMYIASPLAVQNPPTAV